MVGEDEQRREGGASLVAVVDGTRTVVRIDDESVTAILRLLGLADLQAAGAIAGEPNTERVLVGRDGCRGGVVAGLSLTSEVEAIAGALIEGIAFEVASELAELGEGTSRWREAPIILEGPYAVAGVAEAVADIVGHVVVGADGGRAEPGVRARGRRARWRRWVEDQGSLT